jgi:hypothetical protein
MMGPRINSVRRFDMGALITAELAGGKSDIATSGRGLDVAGPLMPYCTHIQANGMNHGFQQDG